MVKGAQSPYFEKIDADYKRLTVTINVKTPSINTTIIKEQGGGTKMVKDGED